MNIGIEILQTQKKEITHYAIAKISKVSFNTVKKHMSDEYIKSLNEMKQNYDHLLPYTRNFKVAKSLKQHIQINYYILLYY